MKNGYRGDLRHVLKLQGFVLTADGSGGHTRSFQAAEDCPSIYAAIYDVSAARAVEAGAGKIVTRHKIVVAYRADIKPDMRLLAADKTYTIEAVLDVAHRKEYLELQVRSE